MPTDKAAVALPRVKQLAEDYGRALDRAYRLLASGALEGPAADALYEGMASRHRTIRSMFLSAFDEVRRLAAQSPDGAPNIPPPALGPPQGPPMSRPGVGSGDPDLLNLLGIEVGRAGHAWEDAGHELSRLLGWLGLSDGPGQSIARSGGWIAGQKGDLERRRDDLVKAGIASPTIPQPATPPPQTKSTSFFGGAWNQFAHHFVPGLWDVAKDNTKSAFAANPVTSPFYMLYDREDWQQRQLTTISLNLIKGLQDPKQLGGNLIKGIVDYDTFKKDKVRWAGHILPDVVIGIATLGEGAGFKAAQRAATRSTESLASKFGSVEERTASKVDPKPTEGTGADPQRVDQAHEGDDALPNGIGVPVTPALREAQRLGQSIGERFGVVVDYLTHPIDARSAEGINQAMAELSRDYPGTFKLMETVRIESFDAISEYHLIPSRTTFAFSKSVLQKLPDVFTRPVKPGLYFMREWFENNDFLVKRLTKRTSEGFFVPGSGDARAVFYHEFGHQLAWRIINNPAWRAEMEAAISKAMGGHYVDISIRDLGHYAPGTSPYLKALSGYGARNTNELLAEAFAEWKLSPNPRALARAVGGVIDKYLKESR